MMLKLREHLEVRLPETPYAGYLWELRGHSPCLTLEDSDYYEDGPARFTGQGERHWRLRAVASGECALSFFLSRPWAAPALECSFSVIVK